MEFTKSIGENFLVKEGFDFRRSIFAWCLRQAREWFKDGGVEGALQWTQLAARIGCMDCGVLASAEIEHNLVKTAPLITVPKWKRTSHAVKRWLHVFSDAGAAGGHTAMAWRWMSLDPGPSRHSAVVLSPLSPICERLAEVVSQCGGELVSMDPNGAILERAERLRQYAFEEADVVVLHVHPWEVAPVVAFGIPEGPPVLLVNHAAHLFGVGCRITDVMINCRQSTQEDEWSKIYRGMGDRVASLPIPLPGSSSGRCLEELKAQTKRDLNIPQEAAVLLTVGNSYKYTPLPGYDFLEVANRIVQERPGVYLLAVGVFEDQRWREARIRTGGRLRALGVQINITPYHAAADIYMEGFPFGSATALLEAAHQGLPCVLAPQLSPPPFGTDGAVFDEIGLSQPANIDEYVSRVMVLLDSVEERNLAGKKIAESVEKHHSGSGWLAKLEHLKKSIPENHRVYPLDDPPPIPWAMAAFWAAVSNNVRADPLGIVFRLAAQYGLRPRFDQPMRDAIREAKTVRSLKSPLRWAMQLTDSVARLGPDSLSGPFYRWYVSLANLFRDGSKLSRVYSALARIRGGAF